MHECPTCQSDRIINHGSAAGKPKKAMLAQDFARMGPEPLVDERCPGGVEAIPASRDGRTALPSA
jgi:hypothetical protein